MRTTPVRIATVRAVSVRLATARAAPVRLLSARAVLVRAVIAGTFALLLLPAASSAELLTRGALEVSSIVGWSDDDGVVSTLPGAQRSSIGFEGFARLSGPGGDIGTADVQLRLGFDSDAPADEAWALEVHNAWLSLRLGLGRRLRLGHFAPAHGLEPIRDTHGSLAQTLAPLDLGFKKDWGVGYEVIIGPVDVTLALQTGTGMAPSPADGSYLVTAQAWTPPGREMRSGVSFAHGELRRGGQARTLPLPDYDEGTQRRTRVGLAMERTTGAFLVLAEASGGTDASTVVGGALFEVDWTPPAHQRLTLEWQVRAWDPDLGTGGDVVTTGLVGASFLADDSITLRAAVSLAGRVWSLDDVRTTLQIYYYGG